jgi:hypothetical protein
MCCNWEESSCKILKIEYIYKICFIEKKDKLIDEKSVTNLHIISEKIGALTTGISG